MTSLCCRNFWVCVKRSFFFLSAAFSFSLGSSLNIHHCLFLSWFFTDFNGSKIFHYFVYLLLFGVSLHPITRHIFSLFFIHWNWSVNVYSAQSTSFVISSFLFTSSLSDLLTRPRVSTEFERNRRLEGSRWGYLPPKQKGFSLSSSAVSKQSCLDPPPPFCVGTSPYLLCLSWDVWMCRTVEFESFSLFGFNVCMALLAWHVRHRVSLKKCF